jgi:thiol-disulfide isomerase/thioredoxin
MDTLADVVRALLAVVFTVAAVAKLLDLTRSRRTMAAFGLSSRLAGPAGNTLPFVELAAAILLVIEPTAQVGGILALVLLLAFIGGMSYALAQGRTPDCNCFGQIAAEPIGWRTMVRNVILAGLAVVVAANGAGAGLLAWTGTQTAQTLAVVLALTLVAGLMVVVGLRREITTYQGSLEMFRRRSQMLPESLPIGLRAPQFSLPEVHSGETVTLTELCSRGRPVLLLFVSPNCGPCMRLFPEIERWSKVMRDTVTFAVLSNGGPDNEEIAAQLREVGDFTTVMQEIHEVADEYRVLATPAAVIVDTRGRIASGVVGGPDEVEALVRVALERSAEESDPHRGLIGQAA